MRARAPTVARQYSRTDKKREVSQLLLSSSSSFTDIAYKQTKHVNLIEHLDNRVKVKSIVK